MSKSHISPKYNHHQLKYSFTHFINNNPHKYVSLLITESIASSLNIKAQYLEDIQENGNKSKICVMVGNNESKTDKGINNPLPVNDNVALFRLVPMEDSSTSVADLDDLSVSSQEKAESQHQNNTFYLVPQFVTTSSLMAICSAAHEGNLITDLDKIYIHVCNTDLPLSSSGWVNMCRICHGSDSLEELIGPCRCKGSIALAHLSCLERWLKESSRSHCELCLHHYEIQREPKYSIVKSILIWMTTSGEHRSTLLDDLISFCLYTPAAICSTYILMMLGEINAKTCDFHNYNSGHLVMFCAVVGIAAIDFTYSSWIMMRLQYHIQAWRTWYRDNCCLTLLLPPRKRRRRCANNSPPPQVVTTDFD